MRSAFLKIAIILCSLGSVFNHAFADSCSDPTRRQSVCREMKHLRSQVLVLGAQRDLMKINFPLLIEVGKEIQAGASRAIGGLLVTDDNHGAGLIGVQALATDLVELAEQKSGDALMAANKIQNQCNTCHNKVAPTSGHRWDDIFKSDWSAFYQKCNSPERNPYRCKSMHGMFSYYSGFFTAYQLGLQNYELTALAADEIAKIAIDLKENDLVHGLEDLLEGVVVDAKEISKLASEKNPEAFDRAMAITQTCMKCHADRSIYSKPQSLQLKSLKE